MKKIILILGLSLISNLASAFSLLDKSYDFAAPVVGSVSSLTGNNQVGQIIYDASTNQFKGLNASGAWSAMTAPSGNPVTTLYTSSTKVLSAYILNNGTASISSQDGTTSTFISSVVTTVTGDVTINFASGVWTAAPVCTCTVVGAGARTCTMDSTLMSTSQAGTISAAGGAASNENFTLICVGH